MFELLLREQHARIQIIVGEVKKSKNDLRSVGQQNYTKKIGIIYVVEFNCLVDVDRIEAKAKNLCKIRNQDNIIE